MICTVLVVWLVAARWLRAPVIQSGRSGPRLCRSPTGWAAVAFPGRGPGPPDDGRHRDRRRGIRRGPFKRGLRRVPRSRRARPGHPVCGGRVRSSGDGGEVRPYLLTSGDSMGEATSKITLEDLIPLLKTGRLGEAADPRPGQVGPNRELGCSARPAERTSRADRCRRLAGRAARLRAGRDELGGRDSGVRCSAVLSEASTAGSAISAG